MPLRCREYLQRTGMFLGRALPDSRLLNGNSDSTFLTMAAGFAGTVPAGTQTNQAIVHRLLEQGRSIKLRSNQERVQRPLFVSAIHTGEQNGGTLNMSREGKRTDRVAFE